MGCSGVPDMCKINSKLIPVKAAYFLLLAALAALLPYLPVFMGFLKLSPVQMSIILGTATAVSAPIRLIVGYVADRIEKRSLVFTIASVLTTIFHLSLFFTPVDDSSFTSRSFSWMLCTRRDYLSLENLSGSKLTNKNNTGMLNQHYGTMRCCTEEPSLDVKSGVGSDEGFNYTECLNFTYFENSVSSKLVKNYSISNGYFSGGFLNISSSDSCMNFHYCDVDMSLPDLQDSSRTFWIYFVLFFMAQATFCPLQNILDSLIYSYLSSSGKLEDFGKSRLWGTIGFGISALLSGMVMSLLEKYGYTGRMNYSYGFGFYCVGLLLAALTTLFIRTSKSSSAMESVDQKHDSQSIPIKTILEEDKKVIPDGTDGKSILHNKKEIVKLLCRFYISVIIMTGMVSGILAGCLEGFFYYFLVSLDPSNKMVLGISLAVSCVCEVVVLFFSGRIISFLGYHRSLYLVFFVFVIRFIASSFLKNPWFGLLTEASQSICFGLLYPVMTSWASSLIPPELQSTMQCYIGAIYFSLGRAVGAAIAGVLYQVYGPQITFQVFAGIAGSYLLLLVFTFEVFDKHRLKKSSQKNLSASAPSSTITIEPPATNGHTPQLDSTRL